MSKAWVIGQRVTTRHHDRAGTVESFGPNTKRPWAWVVFDDAPSERLAVWLADLRRCSPQATDTKEDGR